MEILSKNGLSVADTVAFQQPGTRVVISVSRFVEGQTLAELAKSGRLTVDHVNQYLNWAAQVAQISEEMPNKVIIPVDLHEDNVMFTEEGIVAIDASTSTFARRGAQIILRSDGSVILRGMSAGQLRWHVDNLLAIAVENNLGDDIIRAIKECKNDHILGPGYAWTEKLVFVDQVTQEQIVMNPVTSSQSAPQSAPQSAVRMLRLNSKQFEALKAFLAKHGGKINVFSTQLII